MSDYINCDNGSLGWEQLFKLLLSVSSGGCLSLKTIKSQQDDCNFLLVTESGDYIVNEVGQDLVATICNNTCSYFLVTETGDFIVTDSGDYLVYQAC